MVKPRQTSDAVRKATQGVGVFLAVVVGFWLLIKIPVFSKMFERVEAGVVRVGTGVGKGVSRITASEQSVVTKFAACQTNERLLAIDAAAFDAVQREVNELRGLLAYTERTGADGLVADVMARAVDNDSTRVLVDKGAVDGVMKGSAAVIDNGVLFGLVEDVRETTSVVRLVSNAASNIPAAVLGKTRTIGLIEGREGAVLSMDFIPQDAELGSGNLVVTSGLDGQVAAGLIIGLVTEVVSVESAPFQQAFVELLYEPREWTTLMILPPPGL
ncbi:MAG: rod shape-determining protein MreC [Patescibacteria group bacterium]